MECKFQNKVSNTNIGSKKLFFFCVCVSAYQFPSFKFRLWKLISFVMYTLHIYNISETEKGGRLIRHEFCYMQIYLDYVQKNANDLIICDLFILLNLPRKHKINIFSESNALLNRT